MGKWLENGDYEYEGYDYEYIPKINERVTVYFGGGNWQNMTVIGRYEGKWVLRYDDRIEVEIKAKVEKHNPYYDKKPKQS